MHSFLARPLCCAAALLCAGVAQAGEVYGAAGLPGVMLGYAHPVNSSLTLRADLATLGTHHKTSTEEGIAYKAKINTQRLGLFGDWFVTGGGFRLTGGLTLTDYKGVLDASGAGKTIQVGDGSYTLGVDDGLQMTIKFPDVMPYLGIGWGHQASEGSGWRFGVDLGVMIGKAKVRATPRGLLAEDAAKADVAKEVAQVQDGAGNVRVLPQLSVSVGYSF
jgi:hypothetical protein